ncbi:MAG: PhzF family phenazine biosynthesis protein [Actinobacteria bacterium]|nr:PhzF family phenazine biosynthesis protein [Actinomycetota bacterium]
MAGSLTALRYAAFTDDPRGGNPAGVVLADVLPDEDEMQRVAAALGFSESAFVAPSAERDVHVIRYFSPEHEVTFCGHATIAAAVAMVERDPALDHVTFATRTDTVPVAVRRDGPRVVATLTSPPASHRHVGSDILARALDTFGWTPDVLDPALAPVVASAGASHLVLPVAERDVLAGMTYRFDDLKALMTEQGWTTVDVVWAETDARYHARNPFPVGGVVEDPATGAAAAAFGGYLRDLGRIAVPGRVTIIQGVDMGRPSVLEVAVHDDRAGVDVSGSAVPLA